MEWVDYSPIPSFNLVCCSQNTGFIKADEFINQTKFTLPGTNIAGL